MSNITSKINEGDHFSFRKATCVVRVCDDKRVVIRTHGHRGRLVILRDGFCIIEKIAWYPSRM